MTGPHDTRQYTYGHRTAAAAIALLLALAGPAAAQTTRATECVAGQAGPYACSDVDLLAHLDVAALGGGDFTRISDLWGWSDPDTGRRYALVGRSDGTAFVDVTEPTDPVYLGVLPHSGTRASQWRDIKTYGRYAYIVADGAGPHGLQVFDLHRLRGVATPRYFEQTGRFDGFGSAHNVFVNTETGFAYVGGASAGSLPGTECRGGLTMLDLSDPVAPDFAGCFNHPGTGRARTGYVHDVQCVVYQGPDTAYAGREICFGSNETALSIADVTDKAAPEPVSLGVYPSVQYTHQGWLSEDHRYFFVGDELDENARRATIRTLVFDVTDLDDPVLVAEYDSGRDGIDHNMYVHGSRLYQANYAEGLVVLDIADPERPEEVAHFDTTPTESGRVFGGTWSVYPYFGDGLVLASSIGEGLFVLRVSGGEQVTASEHPEELPAAVSVSPAWPNPFTAGTSFTVGAGGNGPVRVEIVDVLGRVRSVLHDGRMAAGERLDLHVDGTGLEAGTYYLRVTGAGTVRTVPITRLP